MIHALVLAGAASRQALVRWSQSRSKAAIRLYGRPVIEYVLEALLAAREVASVTVAGAPDLVSVRASVRQRVAWVRSGRTMSQSLEQGFRAIQADGPVLVVACDLPLLTSEAVDDFVHAARRVGGDVVYPVIPHRAVSALARGPPSDPYAPVTAYLPGEISPCSQRGCLSRRSRSSKRRTAGASARVPSERFSVGAPWRGLLFYRMSLAELERRMGGLSQIDLRIVPVEHGCLGFDLDSPKDHLVVLRCLARRQGAWEPSRLRASIFERV